MDADVVGNLEGIQFHAVEHDSVNLVGDGVDEGRRAFALRVETHLCDVPEGAVVAGQIERDLVAVNFNERRTLGSFESG